MTSPSRAGLSSAPRRPPRRPPRRQPSRSQCRRRQRRPRPEGQRHAAICAATHPALDRARLTRTKPRARATISSGAPERCPVPGRSVVSASQMQLVCWIAPLWNHSAPSQILPNPCCRRRPPVAASCVGRSIWTRAGRPAETSATTRTSVSKASSPSWEGACVASGRIAPATRMGRLCSSVAAWTPFARRLLRSLDEGVHSAAAASSWRCARPTPASTSCALARSGCL